MIAFLCLTALTVTVLLFVARLIPENAVKDALDCNVVILVLVSVFCGMGLGSFPPFASNLRFYVWDHLVPTLSEVSASSMPAPQATRTGDTLHLETSAPYGYVLQVKCLDTKGNPHFEMVNGATAKLPNGAKLVQIRLVKGNLVTEWTEIPDPTTAPTTPDPTTPVAPVPDPPVIILPPSAV